ncbi:hypothetical protein GW17_00052538 [Ensete ventricosum]|nr:hypothetical protein GW17_00052538 [Ensete ventricosum]
MSACRGGWPWPVPPQGRRPWPGYLQGAASPQGVAARGQPCRQQGKRLRSQGWLPFAVGNRLHRGSGDGDAVRVKEG